MGCLRFGRHFGCGEFAVFFDLFMVWNIVFFYMRNLYPIVRIFLMKQS